MEEHEYRRLRLIKKIKLHVEGIINPIKSLNILQQLKFYEIVCNMLITKTTKNKREIFYSDVKIFKKQNVVDSMIKSTCRKFNIVKSDLFISNSLKGIFFGNIELINNGKSIYKSINDINLIPDMFHVDKVVTKCKICIVVEKDTIFSKIYRSYQNAKLKCEYLFICGKGYPCDNTLDFIKKLTGVKFYGLFDFDPYGLEIFITYKYCKIKGKDEKKTILKNYTIMKEKVLDIERIGLTSKDVNFYKIDKKSGIPLNEYDRRKYKKLKDYKEILYDLNIIVESNCKFELESLFNSPGFDLHSYFNIKVHENVNI